MAYFEKRDLADLALSPERIMSRFGALLQIRRLWEPIWQEIANFMLPRKNDITVRRQPGARRTEKLYESTAIFAAELLAASLHGTLTSSYNPWFNLILDDPDLLEKSNVREYLAACTEDIRLAFNRSNFAQESHEGYLDIVCFGTMPLLFEDREDEGKKGEFRFSSIALQNAVIAEDGMGRVNQLMRSIPMTRSAIVERWPNSRKIIPELASFSLDRDEPQEIIHAVIPRTGKQFTLMRPGWASIYLHAKSKLVIDRELGFHEFPVLCPRWTKVSGETWGRGRGHTALPDVKSLNKLVEMELRALGKAIDPPLGAKGGDVIGRVKLERGGITTLRDKPGESLAPLTPPVNFAPVNLKTVALQEAIKKMFYADQLQMPSDNPQMTATESNIRYELMQRVLGPTLGRLETEFLSPLIARAYAIRRRARKLPDPPPELLEARSRNPIMSVGYEGPLARAQKSGVITAVEQLIKLAEPLLQVKPDLLDNVDMDGVFSDAAVVLGISAKRIRDEEQVGQIREERNQQQQQQADAQAQNERMAAVGKMGPALSAMHQAPEAGSVAAKLIGGNQNGPTQQRGPAQGQGG